MKTFEVEVRIRNNRLRQRRRELGNVTQGKLAEMADVPISAYGQLENMRRSPLTVKGDWTEAALRVSRFFCVEPEELFPPETHAPGQTVAVKQLDKEDVGVMLQGGLSQHSLALEAAPDDLMQRGEQSLALRQVVDGLPPRLRRALVLRFGLDGNRPLTLDELGEKLGVGRARAHVLEGRALRLMRRSKRKTKILMQHEKEQS
jgi:DNA-directed RNA polymerase sigma subunit (sigma70/sigma32)